MPHKWVERRDGKGEFIAGGGFKVTVFQVNGLWAFHVRSFDRPTPRYSKLKWETKKAAQAAAEHELATLLEVR